MNVLSSFNSYPPYSPDYGYHQAVVYNTHLQQPQYYHQLYGTSSSSMGSPPYFYGYSFQGPRGGLSAPQAHRITGPAPYVSYPPPASPPEGSSLFPSQPFQPSRHSFPSSTDSQTTRQQSSTQSQGVVTSESSNA